MRMLCKISRFLWIFSNVLELNIIFGGFYKNFDVVQTFLFLYLLYHNFLWYKTLPNFFNGKWQNHIQNHFKLGQLSNLNGTKSKKYGFEV